MNWMNIRSLQVTGCISPVPYIWMPSLYYGKKNYSLFKLICLISYYTDVSDECSCETRWIPLLALLHILHILCIVILMLIDEYGGDKWITYILKIANYFSLSAMWTFYLSYVGHMIFIVKC